MRRATLRSPWAWMSFPTQIWPRREINCAERSCNRLRDSCCHFFEIHCRSQLDLRWWTGRRSCHQSSAREHVAVVGLSRQLHNLSRYTSVNSCFPAALCRHSIWSTAAKAHLIMAVSEDGQGQRWVRMLFSSKISFKNAFLLEEFIINSGIPKASSYRFSGVEGVCKAPHPPFIRPEIDATAVQYNLNGREDLLKNIFALDGPVVVVMCATTAFLKYKSGIFWDTIDNCPPGCNNVNHAMLLVGTDAKFCFQVYWHRFCRLRCRRIHRHSLLAASVSTKVWIIPKILKNRFS